MGLRLTKQYLVKNDCYRFGKKHKVKGIMVHSTGANNPKLSRYIQPDDGVLGKNPYNTDWNRPNMKPAKCVHAFIGLDKYGQVRTYQTLPWDMVGWHSGSGSKGYDYNANNTGYIGFEICEDNLKDRAYFNEVYEQAVELCVYLCKEFGLTEKNIIDHSEGHRMGIASNHGDVGHWFPKHGKSMNTFRADVKKKLAGKEDVKPPKDDVTPVYYRVRKSWKDAGSQLGAFRELENAIELAKKHSGYEVYDESGNVVYPKPQAKPKPPVSEEKDYIDKRVESKVEGLRFYNRPSWDDKDVVGHLKKGYGFPRILDKLSVGGAYQYRVQNSKGHIYYVTASDKYVKVEDGNSNTPKPRELRVGDRTIIKSSATVYATGQKIPNWVKGNPYTIQQIDGDRVLLREISSWVYRKDVE